MTEEEWLSESDPAGMVESGGVRISNRKLRLVCVGCCEQFGWLLSDPTLRAALTAAERYADGKERRAVMVARGLATTANRPAWLDDAATDAAHAIFACCRPGVALSLVSVLSWLDAAFEKDGIDLKSIRNHQRTVLRDIVGNPFRPVTFAPAWLTHTAVAIAQAIYEDRAFDRLPILADALQDAGCEDEQVLGHCRGEGPHVRGCWVVDGVLGKG